MKEIKEVDKFDDIEIYQFAMRMNQIAKKAVRRAKEENGRSRILCNSCLYDTRRLFSSRLEECRIS